MGGHDGDRDDFFETFELAHDEAPCGPGLCARSSVNVGVRPQGSLALTARIGYIEVVAFWMREYERPVCIVASQAHLSLGQTFRPQR